MSYTESECYNVEVCSKCVGRFYIAHMVQNTAPIAPYNETQQKRIICSV